MFLPCNAPLQLSTSTSSPLNLTLHNLLSPLLALHTLTPPLLSPLDLWTLYFHSQLPLHPPLSHLSSSHQLSNGVSITCHLSPCHPASPGTTRHHPATPAIPAIPAIPACLRSSSPASTLARGELEARRRMRRRRSQVLGVVPHPPRCSPRY